jgi:hypothetical protein
MITATRNGQVIGEVRWDPSGRVGDVSMRTDWPPKSRLRQMAQKAAAGGGRR